MDEGHRKAGKIVLWYAVSVVAIAAIAFFTSKNSSNPFVDAVATGILYSFGVIFIVYIFDLHDGIDYIVKAIYHPPLFILKVFYTLICYVYDIIRKISDRKYIIVARPLGWGKDAEHRRLERLQTKVHRIRAETEVLDEIHELRMARGRHQNIDLDLERQRLEHEHELEMVKYRRAYGDQPTEEEVKIEMLREQLEHQRRLSRLELEQADRSRGGSQRQLPGPKDDDDVVF